MERKAVYLHLEDESFAKTNRTDEDEIDAVAAARNPRSRASDSPLDHLVYVSSHHVPSRGGMDSGGTPNPGARCGGARA